MNPSTIGQNIKAFLARYSLQQKLAMVFAGGLVIVLTWGMVYFVNKVEYQVLYSELDPAEAQSIVTKLQGMQVPYQLSTDGRTISISSDKLSEVRIDLASQGLPESGRVGWEIFDRTNFGVTNFQEQVNYQRALEGELSKSILTLGEVAAVRVHLVMAKESLYERSDDQTKASVILKLKNGRRLPDANVQGIVSLVASAVKGLSPEKVTVIDSLGKMLSRSDAENSLTGQQLETRQKTENELAAKIVQILEPGVGIGKVKPQVSVTMNFQQVTETQENYDPKTPVVVSSQKQKDTTGAYMPVGGIVGVRPPQVAAATASPAPPTPTVTPGSQTGKESEVVNYEISKSIKQIVNPVGKVEKISVAVVVDNQTESTTGADGKVAIKSTPRTVDEIKKYHDIVAAAIGFNMDRGDILIVENMPFGNDNAAETVTEPTFIEKQGPSIMTGLRYLIIPVAFFLIYFMFIRPIQKSVMAGWIPVEADGSGRGLLRGGVQTPLTVKQLEARLATAGGPSSNG